MCSRCYKWDQRDRRPLCSIEGCGARSMARGWCDKHYCRWRAHGNPHQVRWVHGGGTIRKDGYRFVFVDGKQRAEHRVVMEAILGRPLRGDERVHHKNGLRADNTPENLELWLRSHPPGQRVTDQVAWAAELLARYAPEKLRDA